MKDNTSVTNTLNQVISNIQMEYDEIDKKVKVIEENIERKKRYISSFSEKEEDDFKIFSPRDVESVYESELSKVRKQIEVLENEKKDFYKKLGFLANHMNQLKDVSMSIMSNVDIPVSTEPLTIPKLDKDEEEDFKLFMMNILENERIRISSELHDSTIQDLTHVIHVLELVEKFSAQDIVRARLELMSASKGIREVINNLRNVIFDLRPMYIDDLGFSETFKKLKNHVEHLSSMSVNLKMNDSLFEKADTEKLIVLYRIIQEACANAVKHSKGKVIDIIFRDSKDFVVLEIKDDGIGFDYINRKKTRKNFGLLMMEERVRLLDGEFRIDTDFQSGTRISITLPKKSLFDRERKVDLNEN